MFNFNKSTNKNVSMPNRQNHHLVSGNHNVFWPSTSAYNYGYMDTNHVVYQQYYNPTNYYFQSQHNSQNDGRKERKNTNDSGYNSRSSSESSDSSERMYGKNHRVGRSKRRESKKQDIKKTIDLMSYLEIYKFVSMNLKLAEGEMRINGYPVFEQGTANRVTIPRTRYDYGQRFVSIGVKKRICSRCSKMIEIGPNGIEGICVYMAKGLLMRTVHVTEQMPESVLDEFIETPQPLGEQDPRSNKIYALDCEMVYTVAGLALARLSVINLDGDVLIDVLVKPPTKVLDPNTEFSGVTMKDIEGAVETVESCRRKLFDFINSETILVGHSLESDLKVLRLAHKNVADTAIIYAEFGRKVSLRRLASDFLRKSIQEQNAATIGHNPAEDAEASLSLLKLKIQSMI